MAENVMLTMLKTDLGILTTTAYDTRLTQLLTAAEQAIIAEGASTLDTSSDVLDMQLTVMYAAWLWHKRDGNMGNTQSYDATTMPRMLRLALNNRVFREKAGAADG